MKIILFIRSLELGGAEHQLLNLAGRLSREHDVFVLTFYDRDEYKMSELALNNYFLISLNKKSRWDVIGFIFQFLKVIRTIKPDVIYAFMGNASLIALLAPLVSKRIGVVWGIRSSNMKLSLYGRLQILLRWLECNLSNFADLIIVNSEAGRREVLSDGFKNKKIIVIPNGIDNVKFKKNDISRNKIRNMLRIPADAVVIGTVARHDPMKGLEVFIDAVAIHTKYFAETYFLIIGSGAERYTDSLKHKARSLGLQDCIIWIEKTNKVANYYSVMDVFTSTSIYGEGFSNAIGEAMLSQVPCVVTNVGDAKIIVGDCGIVVPPDSPDSVAIAWSSLMGLSDQEIQRLGIQSRNRILTRYSIESMVTLTESALTSVAHRGQDRGAS